MSADLAERLWALGYIQSTGVPARVEEVRHTEAIVKEVVCYRAIRFLYLDLLTYWAVVGGSVSPDDFSNSANEVWRKIVTDTHAHERLNVQAGKDKGYVQDSVAAGYEGNDDPKSVDARRWAVSYLKAKVDRAIQEVGNEVRGHTDDGWRLFSFSMMSADQLRSILDGTMRPSDATPEANACWDNFVYYCKLFHASDGRFRASLGAEEQ